MKCLLVFPARVGTTDESPSTTDACRSRSHIDNCLFSCGHVFDVSCDKRMFGHVWSMRLDDHDAHVLVDDRLRVQVSERDRSRLEHEVTVEDDIEKLIFDLLKTTKNCKSLILKNNGVFQMRFMSDTEK